MSKVIAVQEAQLKMLRENYDKNVPVISISTNQVVNVDNPSNSTVPVIDMESEVVNLNATNSLNEQVVTNLDATNEVFGSSSVDLKPSSVEVSNPNPMNFEVPYKEPIETNEVPVNVLSDDAYYELLNSLRNMITDFANSAYSAIDKFQEERLQGKTTGANLVANSNGNDLKEETIVPNDNVVQSDVGSNIFDNNPVDDLDKTVVLPANFIAANIEETENEFKMVA